MLALAIRIQIFNTKFPFKLATISESYKLSFRKRKRDLTKTYQEKAQSALRGQKSDNVLAICKNDSFYLSINERFEYNRSEKDGDYKVSVIWSQEMLNIEVRPLRTPQCTHYIAVDIEPRTTWTLPVRTIRLHALNTNDWHTLTAAWKVLDKELILNRIKADLTQLNGYYQSASQIQCRLTTNVSNDANIFRAILHGACTQRNLKTANLAHLWNVQEEEVLSKAIMLKELGYEVRNINTNPLMNKGEWLIPYKFPTLVPQSIQLYKSL